MTAPAPCSCATSCWQLIAYGPLLSDDGASWLGTAVLLRAPGPDAARAVLTPGRAPDDLAAHIARSKQWHEQGRLLLAGAFLDRPEEPVSTMAVLASREDAEEYAAGDPFVVKRMVASYEIRPWANMLAA